MNEPESSLRNDNNKAGGLSSGEARRRLLRDGPNELPSGNPRGIPQIAMRVLAEPMFVLLLAAAGLYVVLGDITEAVVLISSILVIVLITIFQEHRTEHALAKLRDLSSPRALAIRDGTAQRIPGSEVVVGDLVLLAEGDRIPADGVLRNATALSVDESIITGESLPVDKIPNSQNEIHVFSGSLVVHGFGTVEITATGARTSVGKIGHALNTLQPEVTPLMREVRRTVRWLAAIGVLLCVAAMACYAWLRGSWIEGALAGITLAIGVLPEEFPVVLTVFLAMGAWRISKQGVLTRRMPAIETIGAATLLAVDKTGTLTENRMRVAILETHDSSVDLRQGAETLDDATYTLLLTAAAASELDAFDPMERAIHSAAKEHAATPQYFSKRQLVHEYDLTSTLLAVTHVWRQESGSFEVAVKGAPEAVLDLCRVPPSQRSELLERVAAHARSGLRVLAVASGHHDSEVMPETPYLFDLNLCGLICLADPLRAMVPDALTECRQAGIRVVMITGDHPGTALSIARQAGIDAADALTGADIASMHPGELLESARHVNVYARMKPEHKLRLVQAFKQNGEIVVMTGDGINDAPALKAAHVGVAMGGRGTDVAREAASLVLVNDDFASLVGAVRRGRQIYDNIRHATGYLLAIHIPIAGMGLLPVLFGWPLLLYPVHVLFLEFIIDPACSFIFEADAAADDAMRRPPRGAAARLFSRPIVLGGLSMGGAALLFTCIVYGVALHFFDESASRSLAFISMVVANLLLIVVNRTRGATLIASLVRPNSIFRWIAVSTLVALGAVIYWPAAAVLFKFSAPPPLAALTVLASAVLAAMLWVRGAGRARK